MAAATDGGEGMPAFVDDHHSQPRKAGEAQQKDYLVQSPHNN